MLKAVTLLPSVAAIFPALAPFLIKKGCTPGSEWERGHESCFWLLLCPITATAYHRNRSQPAQTCSPLPWYTKQAVLGIECRSLGLGSLQLSLAR